MHSKTAKYMARTKKCRAPTFSVIYPAALLSCGSQLYKL